MTITIQINDNVDYITLVVDGVPTKYTSSTTVKVNIGSTISWTATAKTGYTVSPSSGNFGEISEDKVISPTASVQRFTITLTKNSGVKSITVNSIKYTYSTSLSYPYGSVVNWSAEAEDYYTMNTASGRFTVLNSTYISPTATFDYVYTWGGEEYVDMGSTLGKWLCCNVGASKPEEYGWYCMWASTKDNTNDKCSWENCPYYIGTNSSSLPQFSKYVYSSSYGTVDNKNILEAMDDVVTVTKGSGYRMPTYAEIINLYDSAYTYSGYTRYNGMNGYVFVSKETEKAIFMPAAGKKTGNVFDSNSSYGYYWSSTLSGNDGQWLTFRSTSISWFGGSRSHGLSVRGILSK